MNFPLHSRIEGESEHGKNDLHYGINCFNKPEYFREEPLTMSRICEICGKKPIMGHKVSHANNKSLKIWYPNLQKIRCISDKTGSVKRIKACTRCIRSGFLKKAV